MMRVNFGSCSINSGSVVLQHSINSSKYANSAGGPESRGSLIDNPRTSIPCPSINCALRTANVQIRIRHGELGLHALADGIVQPAVIKQPDRHHGHQRRPVVPI